MIELEHHRNTVCIAPRHRREHTKSGSHAITATLDSQLDDIGRIKVARVGREGGARRVFDALIYRQQTKIAGTGQAAMIEQRLKATHHCRTAITVGHYPADKV